MELPVRLCVSLLGTFLSVGLQYDCKKLDSYKFPVYATKLCPRNQTEWNERSSAINCTKDTGYLCFPNEKFTQLLEFCYRTRFIWIEKGYCLYLKKDDSTIYSYSCSSFKSGCHNSSFPSYDLFKYPSCTSIRNGCFLAESSCKGIDTTTQPPDTTESILVEIASMNANKTFKKKELAIKDEVTMIPILYGVLISFPFFGIACIIYRKGIQLRKRSDDEEQHTETALELSPLIHTEKRDDAVLIEQVNEEDKEEEEEESIAIKNNQQDKTGSIAKGIQLRKRRDDEERHTDTALELSPLIHTDKRDDAVLIEQVNEEEKKKIEALVVQVSKEEEEEDSIAIEKNQKDKTGSIAKESPLDQAIFQQWKEDDSKFVSTRACKEVKKNIESQNLVIVTGNSGSGKSAIIHHIALCYRSQGLTVKPVYNVKEITDTYSSGDVLQSEILFVFNDPIGKESFDEIAYKSWKEQYERLKACFKNNKMLLSSRKYILLDNRVRGILNDKSCIIDLSDDKLKLNNGEKENILRSYASNSGLSKDDINLILTTEEYFPLLCKLYFSDKNNQTIGPRFFKEPFNVCQEQIRNFREECKEKYFALVLLVLCNNQLCVEDIHERDCLREKFELALKLCEMKTNPASCTIGDALKTLEGFFVKKIDDTYHFYHDFVMEVTTYVFGTDYQRKTIQYADIGFLRRRVSLESSNDNKKEEVDKFTIYLNDKYVRNLADRLFDDVFGDRLLDVVLNPCMRNEKVATLFIQKLKDSPEKLHNLLAKKQLHKNFRNQKDNQALIQSFGSKLDFLYCEDKVPILSVIILFCHTNLSKHCLETLHRMQNSLEGTSLFSAVCCNGSIDLFKIFPKEQIKTLMTEKWAEFYPIHIVSLFHNHEILRELIQVKNEVNLGTRWSLHVRWEFEYTPLMLAAFNTDTSEQNNKTIRNQPNDITVKLLLKYGAEINLSHPLSGNPLHIASVNGNDKTVQLLLGRKADVNSCDKYDETPLHKASEWGHESTVRLLLDKGAVINSCDTNKETPLHKAIKFGRESTVQLLLDKGADIDPCDKNKETPLHKAIKCGNESTVRLLLDKGAVINSCDTNKETPLHKAITFGRESTVQLLLDKGADIDPCDKNKETPLHKAIKCRNESTVQLLLDKGADINSFDNNKTTPLHIAIISREENTVPLFLDRGADINSCDTNKETPLHKAIKFGRESTVQLLLDKGANINSCDTNKETPLHKAIKFVRESIVQLLLDKGADINSFDNNKETPLHKAIKCGRESTVQLLLDKGADLNSFDDKKETPLHKAIKRGQERTIQLLIDKGADINVCNTYKETLLHKVSEWGRESTVQLLLDKGADINSCDINNETPLHKAIEWGRESTVQQLLDKGADINLCDKNKETPLHKASANGYESIVQLLLDKGADVNLCDRIEETPLHKAIKCRNKSIVQQLLNKGADINSCDTNKETPFLKASKWGLESMVQLLLEKGAAISSCDTNNENSLHKASEMWYD